MSDPAAKRRRAPRRVVVEAPAAAPVVVEALPSQSGGISALASAAAPFIYFDGAPNYGVNNGVVNVTLEAVRFTPVQADIVADRVVVAHLRMSLKAAEGLKTALEKALLLAAPPASRVKN